MKTKRQKSVCLIVLLAAGGLLNAETIRFGAAEGWTRTVSEGLREAEGWRGFPALTLSPIGRDPFQTDDSAAAGDVPVGAIDLLLLSEPEGLVNPAGNYRVQGNYEISDLFHARGPTSIRPGPGGLQLFPAQHSMWSAGSEWGDFTLDFRIRPTTLRDGEIFFSWEGRESGGAVQSVTARVEDRRLNWEFRGFFRRGSERALMLRLTSPPLIPGEWRHHRIRFERDANDLGSSGASPGLLEYLVDGIPADMVHATPDGREGSEIFSPRIGALSDRPLVLAPSFTGYFDEFRIAAAAAAGPPAGGYVDREASSSGTGRTEAIDAGYPGSSLTGVRVRYTAPGASRIRFFVRSFDRREDSWITEMPDPANPEWRELKMAEERDDPTGFGRWYGWTPVFSVEGRYFLIGYVLDPDPGADLAPLLSVLEAEYLQRLPPRPPRDLRQERSPEGGIRVSWSPDAEAGVAGWWISWGPRPGDYIATGDGDELHGSAWVPRDPRSDRRPEFVWPPSSGNRIVYTSVRAAWEEGGPGANAAPGPMDYDALSVPTREMNFRP